MHIINWGFDGKMCIFLYLECNHGAMHKLILLHYDYVMGRGKHIVQTAKCTDDFCSPLPLRLFAATFMMWPKEKKKKGKEENWATREYQADTDTYIWVFKFRSHNAIDIWYTVTPKSAHTHKSNDPSIDAFCVCVQSAAYCECFFFVHCVFMV